jgi:flagellar protein FlbT
LPLKFTLKPGEKVIVNGAVIGRGEEPGSFLPLQQGQVSPRPRGHEGGAGRYAGKETLSYHSARIPLPENAAENLVKFEQIWARSCGRRPGDREQLEDVARLVQSEDYYRALKLTAKLF